MRRGTLPVLLFLLAAGGTLLLGSRILASERTSAFETAKARLRGRTLDAGTMLVAEALELIHEAAMGTADAIRAPGGKFLKPAESLGLDRLPPTGDGDPEAGFYLLEGERAETVAGDLDRAAGLYDAAAAEGRGQVSRVVALYRLAALERRRGRAGEAEKREDAFLAILPPALRNSFEGLVVRLRSRRPDADLTGDLLRRVGGPDEALALGLLRDAGLGDAAALATRRADVLRVERIRSSGLGVPGPRTPGPNTRSNEAPGGGARVPREGAAILAGEILAYSKAPDGSVRYRMGSCSLPAGFTLADRRRESLDISLEGLASGKVIETVAVGEPLTGERVSGTESAESVIAEVHLSSLMLGVEFAALLLAGGAAFVLSVRAARRETEAARARADFVTKVGHDLRTPLAVVRMYAETLAAGKVADPVEAREFAAVAAREAERLTGMVGQVLDLSRVSSGSGALARQPVDLAALAAEVAAVHRPLLEHAGRTFVVHPADPLPVLGDSAALRGAVSNLLENAGRHGASGGSVEIESLRDGRMAVVRVLDRGPGLPPGMEESVFERFVRGPGAAGPGAGLGLALVRETAAAHGGTATASNREGGGAVFTLSLPVAGKEGE